MKVVKVGRYNELDIEFPAKFYDSLEDEAPIVAEDPFSAPNWGDNIVAVVSEEPIFEGEEPTTKVYLLGRDYDEAIRKLAKALYDMEKIKYKYLSALWYDPESGHTYVDILPGESDELEGIAVTAGGYSYVCSRRGRYYLELDDSGDPFNGWLVCPEEVPVGIKMIMLDKLVAELFET